jgi:hypothetical protein
LANMCGGKIKLHPTFELFLFLAALCRYDATLLGLVSTPDKAYRLLHGIPRSEITTMFGTKQRGGASRLAPALSACSLLLLAACGGMGGSGMSSTASGTMTPPASTSTVAACTSASCGSAMMTMTDAKGDFLSYIVNLTSLQLQTAAGASVETLPVTTKVDFSQLVDLTEVMSAGQIPAAEYVSATLTIDYTNANITADDGTGKAVPLSPVDSTGAALTGPVTVSVTLDNAHHLIITPGDTGLLAFDFNLAASNTVNLTASTVTVSPTLAATVVPSNTKQIRVRGQLASASASANDFVLNVQPFHDMSMTTGQVTVDVAATTTYQINGTSYVGMAGITALAALPANTMIAAFGSLMTGTQTLTASSVLAGTSLENPAQDQISGTVISRTATALTVRGATYWMRDGSFDFEHNDVTVNVGAATEVTEEGVMGTFTVADVSVGQHVDAFGTLSGTGSTQVLDATAGEVRLDLTPAWGVVTSLAAGTATLNLQSLDGLAASAFNFAGTGTSTAMDATAAAYVVNTGTVAQTGLAVNAPARIIGFVTPFGMAPPDFTAQTLVNFSAVPEALVVDWAQGGTSMAFTGLTATSTSLQLDLTGVGNLHFIQIGPETLDLTTLATAPTIVPDTTPATDLFTIGHRGKFKNENFNTFAAFITALTTDLTATTTVIDVAATGQYDSTTNAFTATRLAVLLSD